MHKLLLVCAHVFLIHEMCPTHAVIINSIEYISIYEHAENLWQTSKSEWMNQNLRYVFILIQPLLFTTKITVQTNIHTRCENGKSIIYYI